MRPPYGHGPYGHGPTCNLYGRKANRNAPHAGSRNQRAARFPEPTCGASRVRRDRNCLVPGTAPHAGSRNWGWGVGDYEHLLAIIDDYQRLLAIVS